MGTSEDVYGRGDRVSVQIRIEVEDGSPGDRVVALSRTFPDGGPGPATPRNVLTNDGRATVDLHLPLNGATGTYHLQARDLSSGEAASVEFRVEAGGR